MKSTFRKPYHEEFARQCIEMLCCEFGWKMKLNTKDPPDIVDEENSVGIEVTRAVYEFDEQLSNAFAAHKGKTKDEISVKLLKKTERQSSGFIFDNDSGNKIIGASFPVRTDLYEKTKEVILKKTEKLNKDNYLECNINALFIFNTGGFYFKDGLKRMMKELQDDLNRYKKQYSILFFFCSRQLFIFDGEKKTIVIKQIEDETIEELKKKSLYSLGRKKEYDCKQNFSD